MKKRGLTQFFYLIIVLIAIIGISIVYFLSKSPKVETPLDKIPLENFEQECLRVDGNWMKFSNGCRDSCDYRRNPRDIFCTQAFIFGCECGKDRCWNGRSCEPN